MKISENLKRGVIDLLLLTLLQGEDMYGYQLCQELSTRSKGLFVLQESSMYPSLYRLSDKGYISDRRELVGKRRTRVYYHLEPAGKAHLETLHKEYEALTQGVHNLLTFENNEAQT